MNDRVKELRNRLGMTQADFGEPIGIKRATIAAYESNTRTPIDAVVKAICKEYGVNEEWLRYGTGEMFRQTTRDEDIARFVGDVMSNEDAAFQRSVISALSVLNADEWELLANIVKKIHEEHEKADP